MPSSSSAILCLIVIVTHWGPGEIATQAHSTDSSTSSSSLPATQPTITTPTTTPAPTPIATPPPPPTTTTTTKPPTTNTTGTTAAANQVTSTATFGTTAPTTGSSSTDSPTTTSMTTTPGDQNGFSTAIPSSGSTSQSNGLDEKSEIAIVVVSILGASALIVVFVAVVSMRLSRRKEKPRDSMHMEMTNMNGYPSMPGRHLPSNHGSVASSSNASGSRATVTLSVEPLVHG